MYQILLYKKGQSEIATKGSYQDCQRWLVQNGNLQGYDSWELKSVPQACASVDPNLAKPVKKSGEALF
jgi:hypothetical protein